MIEKLNKPQNVELPHELHELEKSIKADPTDEKIEKFNKDLLAYLKTLPVQNKC